MLERLNNALSKVAYGSTLGMIAGVCVGYRISGYTNEDLAFTAGAFTYVLVFILWMILEALLAINKKLSTLNPELKEKLELESQPQGG